jgi:hypothetical protein
MKVRWRSETRQVNRIQTNAKMKKNDIELYSPLLLWDGFAIVDLRFVPQVVGYDYDVHEEKEEETNLNKKYIQHQTKKQFHGVDFP